jgi:hypothetical protein
MSKNKAAGSKREGKSSEGKSKKVAEVKPIAGIEAGGQADEISLASGTEGIVSSSQEGSGSSSGSQGSGSQSGNTAAQNAPVKSATGRKVRNMDINLVKSNAVRKDDRLVIFNFGDGRKGSVQFLRTLFGEEIPTELTLSGEFSEPRTPKAKETAEERKARLKLLPKLTLEEKVAKAEEKAAKLRQKLAAKAEPVTA